MRIALVNPVSRRSEGYHTANGAVPQLGLQVLARLTPDEHHVDIIDEALGASRTEELLRAGNYDLVGLTAYTSSATRAYEIAGLCRQQGIATIMGGAHATAVPDEPGAYVDSVAVGECDVIWQQILADAQAGRLAKRYDGSLADLSAGHGAGKQGLHPINGHYERSCIQTSRGCPVGCDFCSVTRFSGRTIRRRPISDIIDEWNQTDTDYIFVVDDNFFGVGQDHVEWARELLKAIIKHGRKRYWFSQTSLNIGADVDSLRLAYKAGCRSMLVGLETFNDSTLQSFSKGLNRKLLTDYRKLVDGFHKAGLAMMGCFIAGGDQDTQDTVAETALRAVQLGIDIIQFTTLTPLPGTKLYERWLTEKRLTATDYPTDWERYTFTETVFKPALITQEQLDEAIYELRWGAARYPWVWKRTLRSFLRTRSLTSSVFVHWANSGYALLASRQMEREQKRLLAPNGRQKLIRKAFSFFHGD